jgi:hypothetical protein
MSPEPGVVGVQVSFQLAPLLTWACLFVVMLTSICCLVQGFLGGGDRANDDRRVARTTLGPGEGARRARECPLDQRARVVKHDYHARLHASTAGRQRSLEFDQVLSGRRFILSVQETDVKCREEELANDQA